MLKSGAWRNRYPQAKEVILLHASLSTMCARHLRLRSEVCKCKKRAVVMVDGASIWLVVDTWSCSCCCWLLFLLREHHTEIGPNKTSTANFNIYDRRAFACRSSVASTCTSRVSTAAIEVGIDSSDSERKETIWVAAFESEAVTLPLLRLKEREAW